MEKSKAKELRTISKEIEYILKSEINIDDEIDEKDKTIDPSIIIENMIYNINKKRIILSSDDIDDSFFDSEDNNLLYFICICNDYNLLSKAIEESFEKIRSFNNRKTSLKFYIIVFSFEDKVKINDLKVSFQKQRKVKIDFIPFFLALNREKEGHSITIYDNISNCIRLADNNVYKQDLRSELYAVRLFDLILLYNDYGDDLFKDNVRFHLDIPKYNSVDEKMIKTLELEPQMFWFYHNGITLLLKDECINRDKIETITIEAKKDISIINGAQTIFTVSNYYYSLEKEEEKNKDLIKNIKEAKVLLRIITNNTDNSEINKKITIYLNSQKPVGEDDIKFFNKEIQDFNNELPEGREIVRNGDPEDKYSINLINFLKFYAITFLQKPGLARSNKGKLLNDEQLWNSLDLSKKEPTQEKYEAYFKIILDTKEQYKKLKDQENKNNILKYGKEFCLAYYFWQINEYSDNDHKVDFTKDFNSFVKDFIAILSKYEIKGKSEYDSNYFKIDSNYETLRNKLDKYFAGKKEQDQVAPDEKTN